jgi:phosphatidylserine/phosphatidylglycerophosphate/cardiolipin synthase-like enzyme
MDSSALTQRITQLSLPALSGLATALEMARLHLPVQPATIARYVPSPQIEQTTEALNALHQQGMTAPQVALMLRLLITERRSAQTQRNQVELVWTGLETPRMESRDTQVVVQEMFSRAEQSVLISTYAIDQDQKAQNLFDGLAQRMDRLPQLNVQMFLNIQRPYGDRTQEIKLLQTFAHRFRQNIWHGKRLPKLFYDPRSLSTQPGVKACLHAKCVIVDDLYLLITSANFTEAAHQRNLEAGVLLMDAIAARAMRRQFTGLLQSGRLQELTFP